MNSSNAGRFNAFVGIFFGFSGITRKKTAASIISVGVSLGDSSSEIGELTTDYDKPSQLSLTAFIKSYVGQAELVESVGTEMTYVLPTGESYGSKFENLFEALNQNLERFNISSFGISDTTLEEVSMNCFEKNYLYYFFNSVQANALSLQAIQ